MTKLEQLKRDRAEVRRKLEAQTLRVAELSQAVLAMPEPVRTKFMHKVNQEAQESYRLAQSLTKLDDLLNSPEYSRQAPGHVGYRSQHSS